MNKANSIKLITICLSFLGLILFYILPSTSFAADRENNHPWKGFWIAEEVGIAFDIRQHYYLSYQIDGHQCFRPNGALLPPVGPIWQERIAYAKIHVERRNFNRIHIERFSTPERIKMTRVNQLPGNCQLEGDESWHSIAEGFFYNFEQYYAGFKVRKLDKEKLLAQYRAEANNVIANNNIETIEQELFKVFTNFIDELSDQHIFISSIANNWWHKSGQNNNSLSSEDLVDAAKGTVKFINQNYSKSKIREYAHKAINAGKINSSVYYFQINRLINFAPLDNYSTRSENELKSVLRQVARDSRKQEKLIIDLRFNEGGSIKFANQIAAAIIASKKDIARTTGSMVYGQQVTPPVSLGVVEAQNRNRFQHIKEIWVLISHRTASAAEYLTHNLLADQRVKTFGEPSRGTWSPTLVKSLANGWIFTVPNYRVYDSDANEKEGVRINPNVVSKSSFITISTKKDPQIEEVLFLLNL
ncbi:hypothetical protein FLL45_07500 [Aliikangiella marina]|uniref:Tail specific protease domain-containing protein n=1 Tax=Aliikangiella marina TaxID=1712262 RepID=A0A545TC60_9GAMM|nr:S41 family peptidase [Aliikangiella marina]TQV74799.1 hypothetical protein FLL45_07500 [Aliikangiella marina]